MAESRFPSEEEHDIGSLYDFSQASHSGETGFDPYQNDKNEQFYFLFNDQEGNPILFSRPFPSLEKRDEFIRRVIRHAGEADHYERRKDEDGQFFILLDSEGEEVGRSKIFAHQEQLEDAIAYVMAEAPTFSLLFPETSKGKASINDYDFEQTSQSGIKGFDLFRSQKNKLFYFHFNDDSGKPLLYSESYASSRSRKKGIISVIRNGNKRENYRIIEEGGLYFASLVAMNGQEIARSKSFDGAEEVEEKITYVMDEIPSYSDQFDINTSTETEKSFQLSTTMSKDPKNNPSSRAGGADDYDLSQPSQSGQPGFESFLSEKHGQHYFHYNGADGQPIFYSEGYQSDKSRDNGIRSVIKNSIKEKHFADKEDEEGKYFTLRAGNYQEIGRSKYFENDEELRATKDYFQKNVHRSADDHGVEGLEVPAHLMAVSMARGLESDSGGADDYDLTQPTVSGNPGFDKFYSDKHGQHYFHYNGEDGQPMFFSEGYQNDKSRDNGVRSVIKNSIKEKHFADKEDEEGKYFTLRAGNYQEIGRSKYYDSTEELQADKDYFQKNVHRSADDHGVEGLEVPAHLMAASMARGLGSDSGGADDYDLTQPTVSGNPGFDKFHSDKHGQHYFHYNGEDGQPMFFSEGYQNDKSRDNGVRSVIKNSIKEKHFADKEDEEGKYFTLRAGNYQEIGRSKYFETDEELHAAKDYFQKNVHRLAADHGVEGLEVPAHLMATSMARGLGTKDRGGGGDDYDLTQPTVSGKQGFDSFYSETHDQHYFHYNGEDGQPVFFSEGYQNDKSRDNGLKSVIKNSIVEEHYAQKEDENGQYFTLRAGNYQEIGRSKYYDSEEEMLGAMAWFKQNVHKSASLFGLSLSVPAALLGSETESSPVLGGVIEGESEPEAKTGNDYDGDGQADTIQHKPQHEETEEEESRGRPWWLWLLLLIALLLILFLLLRGCEGSPFYAGGEEQNPSIEQATNIPLGEMGNLQTALDNGFIDKTTYGAILDGKSGKGDIDWASKVNGEKLISAGILTQAQWEGIKAGEIKDWDWMQMKPGAEIFGGLGGLKGAQNDLYIDTETADSLRLGNLDIDEIDLATKLDIAKLMADGKLTEEQSKLLKPGEAGWNAIMINTQGASNLQLGAWGSIKDLLDKGIITQQLYDSLVQVGSIDLANFDWERHINLEAAAQNSDLITATLVDQIKKGEIQYDWENRTKIPLSEVNDSGSSADSDQNSSSTAGQITESDGSQGLAVDSSSLGNNDRTGDLTPLPTYGPYSGFSTASASITESEIPNFERLVAYLKRNTSLKVLVTGHADERGTDETNMALGLSRANTVKGLLVKNGIPADRIETASAGESQPRMANTTAEGMAVNRRVEILLKRN